MNQAPPCAPPLAPEVLETVENESKGELELRLGVADAQRVPTVAAAGPRIGPRTVVSSLWLFAILNYLYCDVLGLMYPEALRGFLDGKVGGLVVDQQFLLNASILMTVPMASVLISRIAAHRFARIESIVAAVVMTLVQVDSLGFGTAPTLHFLYFSAIEVATTIAIVWVAARSWKFDS